LRAAIMVWTATRLQFGSPARWNAWAMTNLWDRMMEPVYSFDPEKWHLGALCKRGHRWPGTELSLRRNCSHVHGAPTHCAGCVGRKKSSWLISFMDAEAMGLPSGHKFGKLCSAGHKWENRDVTLKNKYGKCVECEKARNHGRAADWRKNNPERYKESNATRWEKEKAAMHENPEERAAYNRRKRLQRQKNGRRSRSRHGLPHRFCQDHSIHPSHGEYVAQLLSAGVDPGVVRQAIEDARNDLWPWLERFKPHPTVAQLVEKEQCRYEKQATRAPQLTKSQIFAIRYKQDPDLRLYHREKSKRRKAQLRESIGLLVTTAEITHRFQQFDNACAYCGVRNVDLQIEHLLPISLGGTHTLGNIVPACSSCNYSKATKEVEGWYRSQPFFSQKRWNRILRVTGRKKGPVAQLTLC
jgi:hypothetical protein